LKVYVALLRSINVSGHHIIKMADLKMLLKRPEFVNITTYLQSGNLVFQSDIADHQQLEALITDLIKDQYAYDIKVKVIESTTFQKYFLNNPFLSSPDIDTKKLYYIHALEEADLSVFEEMKNKSKFPEEMFLVDNVIYVLYPNGFGRSKLTGALIEKNLKVSVTARNYNTMKNLCEKLEELTAR